MIDMSEEKFHLNNSKNKRKQKKKSNPFLNFIYKYKFEFGALTLFSLGVFLLTEKLEIKSYIFSVMMGFLRKLFGLLNELAQFILRILRDVENSDIIGFILILASIFLLGHRYRIHLWKNYGMQSQCPECQGALYRSHRQLTQKLLSILLFVKVKNYKCKKCSKNLTVITQK